MIQQEQIRNFVIISHIDHGKSTLADRFLELTGSVDKRKMQPQYLDMMDLERERGITIKMQPVRMAYVLNSQPYVLNLIDTPGHVDFSYEVSRSLAAVEGAILLVDATKGIQAQTLANLDLAKKQDLVIIPAVNKIDLQNAQIQETIQELAELLKIEQEEIIKISAKDGTNVEQILRAVIEKVPPPERNLKNPFRALVFDSKYDAFQGVVAYIRIVDGEIRKNEPIYLKGKHARGEVKEVGYFKPALSPCEKLVAGEIGYIATGIKIPGQVRVGDTITIPKLDSQTASLPGYQEPKPVVFVSLYPENQDDYKLLTEALSKLKLNDSSLVFEAEACPVLGRGFRCGFLGMLHAEITIERLRREFGLGLVISTPQVSYKVTTNERKEFFVYFAADWPETSQIQEMKEQYARLEVVTPITYIGRVSEILKTLRGQYVDTKYLSQNRVLLIYETPLREIMTGFYDKLKGATQGYASLNYELLDYRSASLVKLEVFIAGEKQEVFSKIIPEQQAYEEGKALVEKLKKVLPSQQFAVPLQAAISGKIIARQTIKAQRRDVTASLYGGDYSRKRKLLEKQKKGKEKLKARGKMKIPPKVFLEMFKA